MTEYLVDLDTGCWVWQRAKTKAGYGQMYVDGKMRSTSLNGYGQVWHEGRLQRAHRVFYQLYVGPIPDGLQIDHTCGNKLCVNPDHLDAVTAIENTRRALRSHHEN